MDSKGRNYPKNQINRLKEKQVYSQKSTPTENESFPLQEELIDRDQDYDQLRTHRVPVEKSSWKDIVLFLKVIGSFFTVFALIYAIASWVVEIEFKVDNAEENIKEQKLTLNSLSINVNDINIFNAEVKKDLEYLKENKEETKQDILSIKNKIDK